MRAPAGKRGNVARVDAGGGEPTTVTGFVVAAWDDLKTRGTPEARCYVTGRLDDGRSFAAVLSAPTPAVFVKAGTPLPPDADLDPDAWTTLDGDLLTRVRTASLPAPGVEVVAKDLARADDLLVSLGIAGGVTITGSATPGRRVDVVFKEPELRPGRAVSGLRWLALDLETDRDGSVTCASLAGADGPGEVLFLGPALDVPHVRSFDSERSLLQAFAERVVARDPDVLTGWNVIDFDFRVLVKRFAAHGIPFEIGRTADPATVEKKEGARSWVRVPGRAVLDGMRLVRGSGERFEDLSLDAIAHEVLGEGKTVALKGLAKLDELDRLRRDEPLEFCDYCLRDSELVLRILAKTGLDVLTARRAALTGVSLELAWTSIPAFERVYAAELRTRRVVPPPKLDRDVSGAAGGTVLEPTAGFFPNVLVFDFRSLYPSIMRTFNVDPLAHARADRAPRDDDLIAPNGARFTRTAGVLPQVITRYTEEREDALARGDDTAAYVYKILQNSFYGVLGSPGCRYGRTELAGAITSYGKTFLLAARDFFEARGQRVLYGDTDSVFVLSGADEASSFESLSELGARAADELNARIVTMVRDRWGVPSFLKLRSEKAYRRFFIARLRDDPTGEGRGRAKGYAGLRVRPDSTTELEVKGMEAVRSDFTPLARRFQTELLGRVFAGEGVASIRAWCASLVAALVSGALDDELVYTKALRRHAQDYETETPPVRAARLLGWTDRRGRISYVMTRAGAEPVEKRSSATVDHAHYVERQLLPIAQSVADELGADARTWLGPSRQLDLFRG